MIYIYIYISYIYMSYIYIYILYVRSLQHVRFYMAYKPLTKSDAHGKPGDPRTSHGGFNTSRDPEFHQPKNIHSGKIPKDPCMEYLPTLGLF